MPPSCGFVRCPQKPPPSLRSTPRQLAPQMLAVSAERLRPCGRRGHVWKVRSATSPFHPLQSNASHDDVIDAFKLCINNLRVIFEPQKVHHGPRVALPGDGVASPISVSYKMCLQCSLMILYVWLKSGWQRLHKSMLGKRMTWTSSQ